MVPLVHEAAVSRNTTTTKMLLFHGQIVHFIHLSDFMGIQPCSGSNPRYPMAHTEFGIATGVMFLGEEKRTT
jgi:hypothetical protein